MKDMSESSTSVLKLAYGKAVTAVLLGLFWALPQKYTLIFESTQLSSQTFI